ncbi:Protein of unknown function [Propionibacterium freudenreichii]|nr:Protein of unknown function [Propionibacterium freudenreichii]CEH00460.1 Protein of unknown function [Propionibacterium freudenreichii]
MRKATKANTTITVPCT